MLRRIPVFLMLFVGTTSAWATEYSEIVAFGDSLTDTGNVYTQLFGLYPAPPYYQGRFSNGLLWVEDMAAELGLPAPVASLLGGTNNSWGGAETGGGFSNGFVPNIGRQIGTFLNANDLDGSELISVWGGGNDFLNGESNASGPVANMSAHIQSLASGGGTAFIVPNLPPLGQLPSTRGTSDEDLLDQLTIDFNTQLAAELDELRSLLGVTIFELDVYGAVQDILIDPAAFGFVNVTDPAYDENSGDVVPNPDEYLFWDGIHPTAAAHELLGLAAAALIPEPAMLGLTIMAGVMLSMPRRNRTLRSFDSPIQ